jgi:uncharacterized SAM-binding protein YcdF (DUF218 family)
MIDAIAVKAVLKTLVLPPTGPLLLAVAGLLLLGRGRRLGRTLAWLGVGTLLALSLPVVSLVLQRAADGYPVFDPARAARAQALVILGSGVRRNAREFGGDTLGLYTLERVRYGARLARQTGLPVLVSGGVVRKGAAEADLMRASLTGEFGVAVRWVENRSRDTHENAQRSAAILLPAGVRTVVLVAHSVDMRRCVAEFAAAGIAAIPAPIGLPHRGDEGVMDYLPGIAALNGSYRALYEMTGELVRRLRTSY